MSELCSTPGCTREPVVAYMGRRLCWACEDQRRLREGTTPDLSHIVPQRLPRAWVWLLVAALALWAGYCVVVAVS